MPPLSKLIGIFLVCSLQAFGQTAEINQLRDSLAVAKDETHRMNLLLELAKRTAAFSPDSAIRLAISAAMIAQKSENQKDLARVNRLIAKINYDEGKYSLAIENYTSALHYSQLINDSISVSTTFNNIGRAYRRIGEPKEAIEYFQKSFDWAGDDTEMIGVVSNNMAMVLNDVGDDSLALHYYEQSLSIAKQIRDTSAVILSLNNLGSQYIRLKDYQKAERLYLEALSLTEKIKESESFGLTYDNIGLMWEDRGNYKKALGYYLKELEFEKKTGVKVYVAEALESISRACLKLNNHQMALKYAMEGFKMSEQIQSAELKATAAQALAASYEGLKQYDQSLRFTKIAHAISDSINSIAKAKTVSNLAATYELKKKEVEMKSLNRENQMDKTKLKLESRIRNGLIVFLVLVTALLLVAIYLYRDRRKANQMLTVWSRAVDQKNQELNNLNKVKDKIFSTIAHDVRSPLASIQSMLALMNLNALSETEIQKMTVDLSARVNTTSSLLDNLLNWSRNQIATAKVNPVKTDVQALANECIELYANNAIEKNIKLVNKIPESHHIMADEEMIRITLRNLISNAIKFTPQNGEVNLEAHPKDGLLCISVRDSGIGIPQEDLTKIFSFEARSTPGTALEKGTGLGLILCKEFIEKNGGEIWVDSLHGQGSTFSFTAPIA